MFKGWLGQSYYSILSGKMPLTRVPVNPCPTKAQASGTIDSVEINFQIRIFLPLLNCLFSC